MKTKLHYDTVTFKKYAFFSYNSNHYDCFTGNVKSINLENRDLIVLDSILNSCIAQNSNLISRKAAEYNKQCIAIIDSSGEKIVWINLDCSTKDAKYYIRSVDDGGDCYATLKINLTTLTYFDLSVNGYE